MQIIVEDFKSNNNPVPQAPNDNGTDGSSDHSNHDIGEEEGWANKPTRRADSESDDDYEVLHDSSWKPPVITEEQRKTMSKASISAMMGADDEKVKNLKSDTELSWVDLKELQIKVSDSLVKKGGMFSFSFPTYKITLMPLGWAVRRKEAEFAYLRKYLLKVYPNQIVRPSL